MKKVIALCGYPTVGKDEIADYLVENHGFTRVAFADPLRAALLALNPIIYIGADNMPVRIADVVERVGWTKAKEIAEVRLLLQRMGTEAGRDIHGKDCWVNIAKKKIERSLSHVVVTDTRFPNEVAMVKAEGAMVLQVTRPGVGPVNDHASEQMNYNDIADGTIFNNGTLPELHDVIEQYFQSVILK